LHRLKPAQVQNLQSLRAQCERFVKARAADPAR